MSRHVPASQRFAAGPNGAEERVCVDVNGAPENQGDPRLDQDSISRLIGFFRALDEWDREANLQ
jgi:hypothetical protein